MDEETRFLGFGSTGIYLGETEVPEFKNMHIKVKKYNSDDIYIYPEYSTPLKGGKTKRLKRKHKNTKRNYSKLL